MISDFTKRLITLTVIRRRDFHSITRLLNQGFDSKDFSKVKDSTKEDRLSFKVHMNFLPFIRNFLEQSLRTLFITRTTLSGANPLKEISLKKHTNSLTMHYFN